jgi:prolyl-tRNA synthetase
MLLRRFARVENVLKEITPKSVDYSQWYVDVIKKADMVDYAPIKGFMVIKPYGYRIWEFIQDAMNAKFRATGHQNAYFPLLIPENLLMREAEHVEGFSPEVAWVTMGGGEELAERLAIRPTSETIIGAMYSKWIQSYRDLPVLMNQWSNVVRWEKATRPFLRTTEFLWQEGHTVHRTRDEAVAETQQQLETYRQVIEGQLAIPVVAGEKSPGERFAGAVDTLTLEALMGDGRALQIATSHFLGQNFSKAFEIQFLDEDGVLKHGWTTSWGVSTRMIGGLIMVHGDDKGLRLPPRVAPVQVVIVPIARGDAGQQVLEYARGIAAELESQSIRVHLDDRAEYTPGYKYNDWEMRGVPLRVEVGPRDMEGGAAVLARRDLGTKETCPRGGVGERVSVLLEEIQSSLFAQALERQNAQRRRVENYRQAEDYGYRGFFDGDWCGAESCAQTLKADTGMTIRCLPFGEAPEAGGRCVVCGEPAASRMLFARAY